MSLSKRLGLLFVALALIGAGCTPFDIDDTIQTLPMSGTWSFLLGGSANDLTGSYCAGAGGFSSGGEANVEVSEDGETLGMNLDNQYLVFYRQGGSSYQTSTRLFPVRTPEGTIGGFVSFSLTVNTPDTIVGNLHWNNNYGCIGDYLFEMELLEPELPDNVLIEPYVLPEGTWSLTLDEVLDDCASNIVGFTGLPSTLELSHVVDLDTGEPDPASILLSPANVVLEQFPSSNAYTQGLESFDLGLPLDENDDVLLDFENETFEGRLDLEADSSGSMTGTLYAGSDVCGVSASVTMNFIGP